MKHIRIRVTSFAKVNKRTVIVGDTGIKIVETSENDLHIFCNPKTEWEFYTQFPQDVNGKIISNHINQISSACPPPGYWEWWI